MTHDRLSTLQVICTESWGFTMEGTEMNQNSHFCKHSVQKAHQALINTLPDTQQDTLITQAVCSRVSGPEQQALMRASDFFFFFLTFPFCRLPYSCLKLKGSPASSAYMMETDESQGSAEQPLHFGCLAEVQQSPSDPPPEPGGALGG